MRRRRTFAVAALVCALALSACAIGGVQLDRDVTVGGMSLSVPSNWVEDRSDSDSSGSVSFTSTDEDAFGILSVSYSSPPNDGSLDDIMADWESLIEGLGAKYEWELVDESVIDGARCYVCDFSVENDDVTIEGADIFVRSSVTDYRIILYGDQISVSALLDTISLD